jgi:hypothetical protein
MYSGGAGFSSATGTIGAGEGDGEGDGLAAGVLEAAFVAIGAFSGCRRKVRLSWPIVALTIEARTRQTSRKLLKLNRFNIKTTIPFTRLNSDSLIL